MVPALYCIVYGVTTSLRRVVLLYLVLYCVWSDHFTVLCYCILYCIVYGVTTSLRRVVLLYCVWSDHFTPPCCVTVSCTVLCME
jgi:hypothetical protein